DRLALGHQLSRLDDRGREVAVKRVQASRVRDDNVVPVAAARAADQRDNTIVGGVDRRTERVDRVDAGVEMRAPAIRRLEPERAWPEPLRDLRVWLRPDEPVLRRMAG